jgi:hypothetical protein
MIRLAVASDENRCSFRHSSQATIKRLHKAVLLGPFDKLRRALPGAM